MEIILMMKSRPRKNQSAWISLETTLPYNKSTWLRKNNAAKSLCWRKDTIQVIPTGSRPCG